MYKLQNRLRAWAKDMREGRHCLGADQDILEAADDLDYIRALEAENAKLKRDLSETAKTALSFEGEARELMIQNVKLREADTFQQRVQPWMMECFGPEISADKLERNDRFIEEALELVQASDYPKERAHQLVEYVYGRPKGEIHQEVGGVMVTLAAHCLAHGVDMDAAAETELARIWTKVEQIRAKQAAKPRGSALPIVISTTDKE